ncbi:MAG: AraC family transcriptional regulator [Eubacterium sp.]|nr:AraC family transcriptional regulator [Eubacterium sp.]MCM1216299.1 AraC family transcriptional regulator [Lachnospiraceae bacterium]MCM1303810.1 AraC family transcriptional regulator [Butyrivibrio sp.]MCM1342852.1 AraC family transcriptional regulator [Muribaculaceae bacterium]MCM1240066.1 AraC family transcriptional regulator [Lachnospiraceae bacterium]
MKKTGKIDKKIRMMDAADERQYMIGEDYEVYEKQGAPTGAMMFHYHNFYEIIYVLEGEYSSMLETQTYHMKKGDFLLIDQNVMHKYHYVEDRHDSSRRIILWVTSRMLAELSGGDMDLSACFRGGGPCAYHFPIHYEEMLQGYLLKLAMTESVETKQPGVKEVLDRGYLTLFFAYLNILCAGKEYLFAQEELVEHPLVEQVADYIDAHMEESISLDCLAGQVHMSKYHFLRKFKELTGMTVHSFVVNKRLIRACEFLREGAGVTESWQRTGFSDYTSYLRNFRDVFGISPGKYRELYPEEK